MTVTVYRSSDTGAPALDGQVGSLINVLDGCLVNGYGSKPAAGWAKAFSGTNLVAYRQGSGSNQFYLKVNDSGPGVGTGKEARIRGYETMTGVSATDSADGSNLFPTTGQMANGLFVRKSNTADAIVRPWIVVADQRTLYFFALTGDSAGCYYAWMFGEFYSFKTSDPGRCMIVGRANENSNGYSNIEGMGYLHAYVTLLQSNLVYLARDAQGSPGSIIGCKLGDFAIQSGNAVGSYYSGYVDNLSSTPYPPREGPRGGWRRREVWRSALPSQHSRNSRSSVCCTF